VKRLAALAALALFALLPGCGGSDSSVDKPTPGVSITDVPGHEGIGVDTRQKQSARTLTAETFLRSYLQLFGGLSPSEAAALAAGTDEELFRRWNDYAGALGLPDHTLDIPRAVETNTLMLGTFERLAIALCDRTAELEIDGARAKHLYDFPRGADPLDRASFDAGFDVLHRTILGYPARLAPGGARGQAYYDVYAGVVRRHGGGGAMVSRLSPAAAGWATVCEGLVRHPEFQLY